MAIVAQAVCVFIYCLVLAWLEVQIEGEHGWAAKLPTWRGQPAWASERSLFFRVLRAAFRAGSGGNELTGYHIAMITFVFLSLMLPLALVGPSPALFVRCLGYFFLTCVTWDFLWFVINPAYGVRRFNKQTIKWHPNWIGPVPSAYPFGFLFGTLGIGASLWLDGERAWPLFLAAPLTELVLIGLSIVFVERARV